MGLRRKKRCSLHGGEERDEESVSESFEGSVAGERTRRRHFNFKIF
jgi:hypothetical protein